MPEHGSRKRRFAAWLLAGVVGTGLFTWVVFTLFVRDDSRSRSFTIKATPSGASPSPVPVIRRPAEVRMALLFDCYEHGIEHAPPRDSSGHMQRRDQHYVPGATPLTLLSSTLAQSAQDVQIRRWLEAWEANWRRGNPTESSHLDELDRVLPGASMSSDMLLKCGVAFNFLDGDRHAARWYRAGLVQAQKEYEGVPPGDARGRALLSLLDQTKALWRLQDHAALEKRFALAMAVNAALTPEARRAAHLHAEMLYYQHKGTAVQAVAALMADHERAGGLSPSDHEELHWLQGIVLFTFARHAEALRHLRATAAAGGAHAKDASRLVVACLAVLKAFDQAEVEFERYVRTFRPTPEEAAGVVATLERR